MPRQGNTDALDMLYEPSSTAYGYDPRLMLCTGTRDTNQTSTPRSAVRIDARWP
jgi:hypothetical protein